MILSSSQVIGTIIFSNCSLHNMRELKSISKSKLGDKDIAENDLETSKLYV